MKKLIMALVLVGAGTTAAQAQNYNMCMTSCIERDCWNLPTFQERYACVVECDYFCESRFPYDPFELVDLDAKDEKMTPVPEEEIEA